MKPNFRNPLFFGGQSNFPIFQKAVFVSVLIIILLLATATLSDYSSLSRYRYIISSSVGSGKEMACDITRGEWVRDTDMPYYTNATCSLIDSRQNCMKYGKRGLESILRWRWQPDRCDIPRFDPARFLRLMRHQSMAFVGDSVARNHMQSLMCLLSKVEYPKEIEPKDCIHCTRKYYYENYDFTVCVFWAPFLVRWNLTKADGQQFMDPHNIYLDKADDEWVPAISEYDHVIVSAAKWFTRPTISYKTGRLIGCNDCKMNNVSSMSQHDSLRMAFRTALDTINKLESFKGKVIVRTVAPPHYENGKWYNGGNCVRTRPLRSNETRLVEPEVAFYNAQMDEFREAEKAARKKGAVQFMLLDISEMMQMRGDGHPGQYGHWPDEKVGFGIDCVHWCLPGPIDSWNELLFQMLSS